MKKSESIGNLALALSKLQGEVSNIYKGKKAFTHEYAEIAAILTEVRPLFVKYELSFVQLCSTKEELQDNYMETIISTESVLMHSSGEWMSGVLSMPLGVTPKGMNKAQAIGAIISYERRYAINAFLCLAQTDTDANIEEPNMPRLDPWQILDIMVMGNQEMKEELARMLGKRKVTLDDLTEKQVWLTIEKLMKVTTITIGEENV